MSTLTNNQNAIYLYLLEHGHVRASVIARQNNLQRTLAYHVLGELEEMQLVGKREIKGSPTLYFPKHPKAILEMFTKQENELRQRRLDMEKGMTTLLARYNTLEGRPSVFFREGMDGFRYLYEDIIREQKPIRLFRSYRDKDHPGLESFLHERIEIQAQSGIESKVLVPKVRIDQRRKVKTDARRKITRMIVDRKKFMLPAQVLVYGNKVGVTTFEEPLMTTIIESQHVAQTFTRIFERMWELEEAHYAGSK